MCDGPTEYDCLECETGLLLDVDTRECLYNCINNKNILENKYCVNECPDKYYSTV